MKVPLQVALYNVHGRKYYYPHYHVWWLLLCVNLLGHRMSRRLAKHGSGCGCESISDEISIWIRRLHKADCPPTMWADATQSMEGRNHQEGWPSHKGRKTSPAWLLWAGTWVLFLSSDLNWKTSSSWFLSLQLSGQNFSLRLEHHQLSCTSSSPNADLGTSHPP